MPSNDSNATSIRNTSNNRSSDFLLNPSPNSKAASTGQPELPVTIKAVDMPEHMQRRAVTLARGAMSQHTVMREIAGAIKREFDREYGTTWHCIVGRSFGSFVTHQNQSFIFFYVGEFAFMLFKTA